MRDNSGQRRRREVMKGRKTSILIAASIFLILSNSVYAYRPVIDLGTLGGNTSSAQSINDNGQIVGMSTNSSNDQRACLFDSTGGGANRDLGTLGYYDSRGYSINNSGQIVGVAWSSVQGNRPRACLFDPTGGGDNRDLGSLDNKMSQANFISNNGKIVGWSTTLGGSHRACSFDITNSLVTNLGGLGGGWSEASSVNDNGKIVGYAWNSAHNDRACLFDSTGGGVNIDLGTLGGHESIAYSINSFNQIVGVADNISGSYSACLFDLTGNGANIDLGPGRAYSINDIGQIAGESNGYACLFDPTGHGSNINLNTLIDPSSGWTLSTVISLNNNGWIVGTGTHNGYTRAFVLTPEPATILLLTAGGLILRRKH